MHKFKTSEHLKNILSKLAKKDKQLYEQVLKKMQEISNNDNIEHYKNLKFNMKDSKRVHTGHFVLIFQYNPSADEINFDDFDHHDKIYNK